MEDLIGFQGKGFVSIFMIFCLAFPFPLMLDRSSIDWVFFPFCYLDTHYFPRTTFGAYLYRQLASHASLVRADWLVADHMPRRVEKQVLHPSQKTVYAKPCATAGCWSLG